MIISKKGLFIQSIVELIVAVLLIIISIPLWINFNTSGYKETAEYYERYNFEN